jgi:chromosome partitioning protein
MEAFADILVGMERDNDFIVIDTPGFDTALMRLVHGLADTLVTPVNDSFVDIDLLAENGDGVEDPVPGPYGRLVAEAREQRRQLDGQPLDWIVVQNRLSMILSNNKIKVREALERLAPTLGFRLARGVSERVIFREFFPLGVTAFDPLDDATFGVRPNMSHVAARDEFRRLVQVITFRGRTPSEKAKKSGRRSSPAKARKTRPEADLGHAKKAPADRRAEPAPVVAEPT